jgi:hypothetical protein
MALPRPERRATDGYVRSTAASLLRCAAITALAATATLAQAQPAGQAMRFTSPDGSTFLLLPDARVPQVHWAVATWVDGDDDPPGLIGLSMTAMHASLAGTWSTGSRDREAERQALRELDDAWQQQLQRPGDAEAAKLLIQRDAAAAALCDPRTFARVLAAAPAHGPEIIDREPVAVLVLTTVDTAIAEVARLLVERREQQVLRGLPRLWLRDCLARSRRNATDPVAILRAEVLALVLPTSPAVGLLSARPLQAPTREQALTTWAASQRPERTVHVLLGDFDPAAAQAVLSRAFASTSLPPRAERSSLQPRPLAAQRRSIIPGVGQPMLAAAWVLPPIADRHALEAVVRWLGGDDGGWIGARLRRAGHEKVEVRCTAPWPSTSAGGDLLLLEVRGADGARDLLGAVLGACNDAARSTRKDDAYDGARIAMQRSWNEISGAPRLVAAELAEQALRWPGQPMRAVAPPRVDAASIEALLAATFGGHPIVVEGRP